MKSLIVIWASAIVAITMSAHYINNSIEGMASQSMASIDDSSLMNIVNIQHDKHLTVVPAISFVDSDPSDIQPAGGYGLIQSVASANWRYYNEEYKGGPLEVTLW